MRCLPIVVGAALGVGLGGCTREYCSDALAYPGFALFINVSSPLRDGVYTWTVKADGTTRTRTVTLNQGRGRCDCAPGNDISMDSLNSEISLLDDPQGPRQAGPSHVEITIMRGPQFVASFVFDPVYRPIEGNCQVVQRAEYAASIVGS
jgi:hypothetical protein